MAERRGLGLHLLVAAVWLGLASQLLPLAAKHAPEALRRSMEWSTFRTLSEALTVTLGVALTFALVPSPREALGLVRPSPRGAGVVLLLAPVVFVLATSLALTIALPTLMDELARRGAGASRANAGGFGRELQQTSLGGAVMWGVLLAAVSEELLFRGAVWSLIDRALRPLAPAVVVGEEAALRGEPPLRRLGRLLCRGTAATLLSAALFGWMHHDLPGGVGIVRVVSTTVLGLAAGGVRQLGGSIALAVLLHATHNALSLAQARGLLTTETFSTTYGVPVLLLLVAMPCALALVLLAFRQAKRSRGEHDAAGDPA